MTISAKKQFPIRVSILMLLCLSFGMAGLRADDPVSVADNLIRNPSFENPLDTYLWKQNNWAKNDVEFALDTDNPHSGKQSQRILLRHGVDGKTDVQLVYQGISFAPGEHLELRFWTRGLTDGKTLIVSLGTNFAPFTKYFTGTTVLGGTWTESVFQIVLPPDADSKNNALIFELKDETTLWIDDVSLAPAATP